MAEKPTRNVNAPRSAGGTEKVRISSLSDWLNRYRAEPGLDSPSGGHESEKKKRGRKRRPGTNMEMHQIRYFLAVCETLNFTRAAEHSNVSQPALTRAIQKLEEELGGQMFRRERNLTHLTDLGRLVRPRLERILRETDAARSAAQEFNNLEKAPLNLGVMCTIGPSRLIGLFSRIQYEMPGVEVNLHEATPEVLIEKMFAGEIDVGLIAKAGDLPDRFDRHSLYRERFVVAYPPGHRFGQMNGFRLYDIEHEPYLSRKSCEFAVHFRQLLAERGITLNYRYRSEREDWIQSMILAGMGCAFMPEYLPMFPGLPTRVISEPEVTRQVELVTVAGRRFSPAVKAFVDLVMAYDWDKVMAP
ncbi:MAG: LysR family transcriptional regulator [Alphaproteobacteria bacterium]